MPIPASLRLARAATSDDELTFVVPAEAAEVTGLRRAVGSLAARAGFDAQRRAEVALAVGEACANVVTHAYVGRTGGTIGLHAAIVGDGLDVEVRDHGSGLAPRADSPGLGLGLPLIAALTTSVAFGPGSGSGSEVRMHFASGAGTLAPKLVRG